MLSVSKGMSPGDAQEYYYHRDPMVDQEHNGQWLGIGAEVLGLNGHITKDDFIAITEGRDPHSGEQLVAPKTEQARDKSGNKLYNPDGSPTMVDKHRACNDLTFSAPKSVSVAFAAGVTEMKDLHDLAVMRTMAHVEAHYSQYRSPEGFRIAGNIVAAKFDHTTSRAVDPQLHSHVPTMNMVLDKEGKFRANEPLNIFKDQKAIGLLYRQELAHLMMERGYEITFTDREQMFFEIKGVDGEVLNRLVEHFSSRREAIETQVAEWQADGKFKGVEYARLYEMAALETRDPKREISRDDLLREWDKGFESVGITREAFREQVEASRDLNLDARQQQQPHQQDISAAEVTQQAAAVLVETEAVMDRAALLNAAAKISGGRHSIADLNQAIDGGVQDVERMGQDARGREHYTTTAMRQLEARNLETVKGLSGTFRSITTLDEVTGYLARLEETEGIRLRPGQRAHVINELTGANGVAVTQGDPGTGKTFASGIIERFNDEVLKPSGREHHTINVAYTGKAALEMASASKRPANTIDSFLNVYHAGKISIPSDQASQVVLRVDEASFVGAGQAEHLLNVVKDLKEQDIRAKLLIIGDTKQMQAIQAGDVFRQLQELAKQGHVDFSHLTEINRQKDEELLRIATLLNREEEGGSLGGNAKEALAALQERGSVTEIDDRAALIASTVDLYMRERNRLSHEPERAARGEKQSVLLVTALNADRQELNQRIREARIEKGEIERGQSFQVFAPSRQGVTAGSYEPGQQVIFSGYRGDDGKMRSWGAPLWSNGEIQSVNPDRNTVAVHYQFERHGKVHNVTKELDAAKMALFTTVHKLQEREFSIGDRIVALKNDKGLEVQNGSMGTIMGLDRDGNVTMRLDDGRDVAFNLNNYQHVDHAYAVTIHKSQGATVETSIMFAYVKPSVENSRDSLESLAGIRLSSEEFKRWNGSISEFERGYAVETMVGEHAGILSFIQVEDRRTGEIQKGIAIEFEDGQAVRKDEATRLLMRDAGMYWAPDAGSWVTSATNDKTAELMSFHPLRDPDYLKNLEHEFRSGKLEDKDRGENEENPVSVADPLEAERFGKASYNALNVSLTRAKFEALLATNSFPGLIKAVQQIDEKTSTLNHDVEHPEALNRSDVAGSGLAEKIEQFKQTVRRRDSGTDDLGLPGMQAGIDNALEK